MDVKKLADKEQLEAFLQEASTVEAIRSHPGYAILERDFKEAIDSASSVWPYVDPNTPTFRKLQVDIMAMLKVLAFFEDYATNMQKANQLIYKMNNEKEHILADVDNESPLEEKDG